jgi:type VII secretion protein EccB
MGTPAKTMIVSRNSLVGAPRGPRIGIWNAPDALPDPKRMLGGAWTLCTQPAKDETGKTVATTVLTVGKRPTGGRDPGDAALLARDPKNNRLYLVWHDHRYEINSEKIVLEGLVLGSEPQAMAGGAWLNALPAGKPIGTRQVADRGQPSAAFDGAVTGRIYVVQQSTEVNQFYLAERSRLAPLTQLQAEILLADPATRRDAYGDAQLGAIPLEAGIAVAAPKSAVPAAGNEQAPAKRPEITRLSGDRPTICAGYEPGQAEPQVLLDPQVPPVQEPVRTAEQTSDGTPLADRIIIEPGFGVLARALPSPGTDIGALNLVTDLGFRYPLGDAVPGLLGYDKVTPVKLPASLVVRVPSGPALDPEEAKKTVDPQ